MATAIDSQEGIMRGSSWTRLTVLVLVVSAGYGAAASGASALSLSAEKRAVMAVERIVQPAAHQQQHWHWEGMWWRHGPWADHAIYGLVVNPPWPTRAFVPWGSERLRRCAISHPSFDPATGTYIGRGGVRRICP